ncbi:MAG: hypothetical protein R3290_10220 [Acidimicrobiia bacterium]|nr:hypothetical protein [Acidimicrobiia bacterium]
MIRRIAPIAVLALALVACGGDPEPTTVDVETVDYAYVGLPETLVAGSTITITNTSDTELHELVALRLPDGEDRPAAEIVADQEALVALFPSVEAVLIAPPGESGFAVEGTGVLDEPGRYLIICAIPTGADPAEYLAAAQESEGGPPDVPGGPPHFVQGMFGELTVEG